MPEVHLPDYDVTLQFPDTMSREQMSAAIEKDFPSSKLKRAWDVTKEEFMEGYKEWDKALFDPAADITFAKRGRLKHDMERRSLLDIGAFTGPLRAALSPAEGALKAFVSEPAGRKAKKLGVPGADYVEPIVDVAANLLIPYGLGKVGPKAPELIGDIFVKKVPGSNIHIDPTLATVDTSTVEGQRMYEELLHQEAKSPKARIELRKKLAAEEYEAWWKEQTGGPDPVLETIYATPEEYEQWMELERQKGNFPSYKDPSTLKPPLNRTPNVPLRETEEEAPPLDELMKWTGVPLGGVRDREALTGFWREGVKNKREAVPELEAEREDPETLQSLEGKPSDYPRKAIPKMGLSVNIVDRSYLGGPAKESVTPKATMLGAVSPLKSISGMYPDTIAAAKETVQATKGGWNNLFSPHAASQTASAADAITAKRIMEGERRADQARAAMTELKQYFWGRTNTENIGFIDAMMKGGYIPGEQALTEHARSFARAFDDAHAHEKAAGVAGEYLENYFPGLFERDEKSKIFFDAAREKLGRAYFKEHKSFDLYSKAIAAGCKPISFNPAELVERRLLDSSRIVHRQEIINDLEKMGLAPLYDAKGTYAENSHVIVAPSGKAHAVGPDVYPVLKNSGILGHKSIWTDKAAPAMLYRGLMRVKNLVMPLKLMSLFHGIHQVGIDIAAHQTAYASAAIKGGMAWDEALAGVVKSQFVLTHPKELKLAGDVVSAWDKPLSEVSGNVAQQIQYIIEGGGSPKISEQFRVNAREAYQKALSENKNIKAAALGIPRVLEGLQYPLLEWWIPRMKVASYMKDVEIALKGNPKLLDDSVARSIKLRDLWKSCDNRYGEVCYKTLFWKPLLKEIGIGSSLSLGWNLGFLREVGGALTVDTVNAMKALKSGTLSKENITDRMLFTMFYTAQHMMLGSGLCYAFTGKWPSSAIDYFYPPTGDSNPDGTPMRVSLPYQTKMFFEGYERMKKEGVVGGAVEMLKSKANPALASAFRLFENQDFYNREIWDPNSNVFNKIVDGLLFYFDDTISPIAALSYGKFEESGVDSAKGAALSVAGFSAAPAYISKSGIQQDITNLYEKRRPSGVSPRAEREEDDLKHKIRIAAERGDTAKLEELKQKAISSGFTTEQAMDNYIKRSYISADARMFQQLPPSDQEYLLRQMNDEEIAKYWPYVHGPLQEKLSGGAQ